MKSKRKANSAAIKECKEKGGRDCQITITYTNQCIALANPDVPMGHVATGQSWNQNTAKRLAIEKCVEGIPNLTCTIAYTGCSLPVFKRY